MAPQTREGVTDFDGNEMSTTGKVARFMHTGPTEASTSALACAPKPSPTKYGRRRAGPSNSVRMQNDIYMPAPFSPLR